MKPPMNLPDRPSCAPRASGNLAVVRFGRLGLRIQTVPAKTTDLSVPLGQRQHGCWLVVGVRAVPGPELTLLLFGVGVLG